MPRSKKKQAQQSVVLKRGSNSREGVLGVVRVPRFCAANARDVSDS